MKIYAKLDLSSENIVFLEEIFFFEGRGKLNWVKSCTEL